MRIFYTRKAVAQLTSLPKLFQKRIATKMRFFAKHEDPLKFAERLTDYNEGSYRFRVGNFRIAFDVSDGTIVILKIGKRDKMY